MLDWYWLNDKSRSFLKKDYLSKDEEPEDRYSEIAYAAEKILGIKKFAPKFLSYLAKGYYSLSTPVTANFGKKRACPISCFGSFIDDTMESILFKNGEVGAMSKLSGGTSAYFGKIRPRGSIIKDSGKSFGSVHFMQLFDKTTEIVSQSSIRRGSFAGYLPIWHDDIEEFLEIRSEGNPIQNMSIGVCVPDKWLKEMIEGDKAKRRIWTKIIKKRFESGYPYLFFVDNANKQAPEMYKEHNKIIYASNLCNEIMLSSNENESFVCNLSSMNLLHYDEWKETDAVKTLVYFLDAVMTEFIDKTENNFFMAAPRKFAIEQRALGLGVLGWHSYLQSKMIPFESMEAKYKNTEIFKYLSNECKAASKELAELYGEPLLCKGYGVRNVTTMAIAPTTSSSFILGQISPSIEPLDSNYFIKDLAKGKFTYKNPYLKETLKKYDKDDKDTWESILKRGGSVQHLKFLSDNEKEVFKTFGEISQKEVIIQAIQRQRYIDQGQSLNLMIDPETPLKEMNQLLLFAWENGIKGLYYQKGTNPSQALTRNLLNCKSCEG